MKHLITSSLKQVLGDRPVALLCAAIVAGGIVFMAYVALSLSPSDLQLAIRYTSFGETNFYRNVWYYLLTFVLFGLMYLLVHVGIVVKLYVSDMRPLAIAFAWVSLIVLVLMFAYTHSVLGIAYLS